MFPRRPRLRSFDYLGKYRYFLTFTTHNRDRLFEDANIVQLALRHILESAGRFGFAVSVYCFMPDHLHMLVEGKADDSDLQQFVKLAKQTSAFAYSQKTKKHLWQPSYYDHVLRDDESPLHFIAYILKNPVVANLASTCTDYPFVGSATATVQTLIEMVREGLGPSWETDGTVVLPGPAGLKACATD